MRKWLAIGLSTAVVAFLLMHHVREGRDALNFSEWAPGRGEVDDATETVSDGEMPPDYYTWLGMHGDAKLTPAEKRDLADGLRRTLGAR